MAVKKAPLETHKLNTLTPHIFSFGDISGTPGTTVLAAVCHRPCVSDVLQHGASIEERQRLWTAMVSKQPLPVDKVVASHKGYFRLAATLGSKSTLKTLPRRSVLTANIIQLCSLIAEPPEPLALRLSSNLMVGVVRCAAEHSFVSGAHSKLRSDYLLESDHLHSQCL